MILATVPALMALDTWVAVLGGWRTDSRLEILIGVGIHGLLAAIVLALIVPAAYEAIRRHRHRIIAVGLSVWGTLALGEAVLALAAPSSPQMEFHQRPPHMNRVYRPRAENMPGISGPSRFTTNSLGIRGDEILEGEMPIEILCIGGSTTECLYLDDSEAWPQLLSALLDQGASDRGVWVGNAGFTGYDTNHHLEYVQSNAMVRERDVLIFLVGVNDLWRALGFDTDRTTPIWTHSRLVGMLRGVYRRLLPRGDKDVEDEEGYNYQARRRKRREAPLSDRIPDLSDALSGFAARIEQIAETGRDGGARVIFVTQPVLWDDDMTEEEQGLLWSGKLEDGAFLTAEKLRAAMEMFNATLLERCRQLGIECVDLSSMSGQVRYFYDDCHLTEEGSREVARLLAGWFAEHPLGRAPRSVLK